MNLQLNHSASAYRATTTEDVLAILPQRNPKLPVTPFPIDWEEELAFVLVYPHSGCNENEPGLVFGVYAADDGALHLQASPHGGPRCNVIATLYDVIAVPRTPTTLTYELVLDPPECPD